MKILVYLERSSWNSSKWSKRTKWGDFLVCILLALLGANLLGNLLTGKGMNKKDRGTIRAGDGIVRAGYGNNETDF